MRRRHGTSDYVLFQVTCPVVSVIKPIKGISDMKSGVKLNSWREIVVQIEMSAESCGAQRPDHRREFLN